MLDEYLRPIEEESQRDAAERPGPAALVAAEAEARRKQNADPSVDHRSEQEKRKDQAKQGKTGSQAVQDKMDAAYRESREWMTKHGQEYAKKEIKKTVNEHSSIVQDARYLANLDYSKLSDEELHKALGKAAQLADFAPLSEVGSVPAGITADMLAYRATKKDIENADVTQWRKGIANALNAIGIFGAAPGGFVLDAAIYESIGALLSEKQKRDIARSNYTPTSLTPHGR